VSFRETPVFKEEPMSEHDTDRDPEDEPHADPLATAPVSPDPIVEWQPNRRRVAVGSPRASGAVAAGALAFGALTLGAFAIGALAIGTLAIGRLAVGRARVHTLRIDRLIIGRIERR
jgi:hypothetical protein